MAILTPGARLRAVLSGLEVEVGDYLGGGGQGEVYRARFSGHTVALKWFKPDYLPMDPGLRRRLESLVGMGRPSEKFLWPFELVESAAQAGLGYVMEYRAPCYCGLVDLMNARIDPTFQVLATAGLNLAQSFLELHARGLCYRDINFGNISLEPASGDIRICDNDNVGLENEEAGILGTPAFMAPEIWRGAPASSVTDLHSLAVTLFYMLMLHHPLEGRRIYEREEFMLPDGLRRLFAEEPLFIFHPSDGSNRPDPELQPNPAALWTIYPEFLHQLFTRAFTAGLGDPACGRVRESEWRQAMSRLRDSIFPCPGCGVENFYDGQHMVETGGALAPCWKCGRAPTPPCRIRVGRDVIMLRAGAALYPHHLDPARPYDFGRPMAMVVADSGGAQLENASAGKWVVRTAAGEMRDVEPGRRLEIESGLRVFFGKSQGDLKA